ncbi:MAG: NUDIX domain-containing protein [Candidatus Magasanikbacteria bacterium]|nr:NUDIX domain-containing protein [Candidatus Magasanikbacteria bacterium]
MPEIIYADELLDLIDDNENVIDTKPRSEIYAAGLHNFRVINAFLVNSNGELWIPRRTAHKRIFPLCLDMSVGGHVESGESYDFAFKRETQEELNIDVDHADVRLLGHLTPNADGVSAHMNVYEIKMDEAPQFNPHDFIEAMWIKPRALLELLDRGEKAKGDLATLLKKFYKKNG